MCQFPFKYFASGCWIINDSGFLHLSHPHSSSAVKSFIFDNYCDLKTLIHILYHSPFHIILKAVTRSPKRNEAITLLVIASFTISRDKAKLQSVGGFLSSPTDEEEHRLSTQLCVATPM